MKKHYDIFISYRREGGFETAQLITQYLKNKGYNVFFDLENLRGGKFNNQLLDVISSCKDFIIVFSPKEVERLWNEDDWVRLEIAHAVSSNKNIIPVLLQGFKFPDTLPDDINEVRHFNGVSAGDYNFFDASMTKLQGFLKSKRGITWQRYKIQFTALIVLMVVIIGIFGYRHWEQNRVFAATCVEQVKIMSGGIAAININLNLAKDAYDEWNKFALNFSSANVRDTAEIRKEFLKYLEFKKNSIENRNILKLSDESLKILRDNHLQPEEINAFYELVIPQYADEVSQYMVSLSNFAKMPVIFNSFNQYAQKLYNGLEYSAKVDYYNLLALFATMPKGSDADFLKIHPSLNNFNEIQLGGSYESYEALAGAAMKNHELIISELSGINNESERVVESMQYNLEKTKEEMGKAVLESKLNDLEQKRANVEARRAEISDSDKKLTDAYERALTKFAIKSDDDQWTQWGKMLRISTLATNALKNRTEAKKQYDEQVRVAKNQGLDPSFLTPPYYTMSIDEMFGNIDKWLSIYQKNFPAESLYVNSAKQFYKAVKTGRVGYNGVLVVNTQNNEPHPVFNIGDIIVERKGQTIRNSDHYGSLANDPAINKVKMLRFAKDGTPQYTIETIPADCKVLVGMVDLTENE